MQKVTIKSGGPQLSPLVAGVMKWGIWGADLQPAAIGRLIEQCIEAGITTFDHADIYGHYTTEALFGQGLALLGNDLKQQLQIVTKCGIRLTTKHRPENRLKGYEVSREYIIQSAENSLRALGLETIDLFLIHRPSPLMEPEEVAAAFEELKSSGKVQFFGVSNFSPSQFSLLSQYTELATNQVECSPLHTEPLDDGTFDQLLAHKIKPMVWSPFGGGNYFSEENSAARRLRDTVREINERYGSPGEDVILLAWLLRHPVGCIPILGTSKIERILSAKQALEVNLDSQDWFAILEAAKGHEVA